uniref:Ribonuclease 3 n=1 Tax=Cacopsylla melanoneura TaxID=428564 RepID=A0A8D8M7L3_9HEMI
MSWDQSRSGQPSQGHCSYPCSYPRSDDVKPNIHPQNSHSTNEHASNTALTLRKADIITNAAPPLHMIDIKQPPPGFSQSCNHKILLSKSYDCKTGTTQVDNLPNQTNSIPSGSISNNHPTSKHLYKNFSGSFPNNNIFQSSREVPSVPDSSLYQSSFSHNSILPTSQLLSTCQNCANPPIGPSNNQTNGRNFHHDWQVPASTPLPFLNVPPPPTLHSTSVASQPHIMLPPLNVPPPNLTFNKPTSSQSTSSVVLNGRILNSVHTLTQSTNHVNGDNERPPRNSNGIHPPLQQRNYLENGHSLNNLPRSNSSNRFADTFSDFKMSFNVPPPSFTIPPPPRTRNLNDASHLRSPMPEVKSETPNSYCGRPNSAVSDQFSPPFRNNLPQENSNLNSVVKRPRSTEDQSCDYLRNNGYPINSLSRSSGISDIKMDIPNVQFNSDQLTLNTNTGKNSSFCRSTRTNYSDIQRENDVQSSSLDTQNHGYNRNSDNQRELEHGVLRSSSVSTQNHGYKCNSDTQREYDVRSRSHSSQNNGNRNQPSSRSPSRADLRVNRSTQPNNHHTRRSRSPSRHNSTDSRLQHISRSNVTRQDDPIKASRVRRSNSQTKNSTSRRKRSSESRSGHSTESSSRYHSSRSESRSRHSTEGSSRYHSSSNNRSKRSRSASRSRQPESQSKRFRRRSRSRSSHRENESSRSGSRVTNSRSNNGRHKSKYENLKSSAVDKRYEANHDKEPMTSKKTSDSRSRAETTSRSSKNRNESRSPANRKEPLSRLDKWRMNNCSSETEMTEKFNTLAAMEADQIIEQEKKIWTRSAPADLHYTKCDSSEAYECTQKSRGVCSEFESIIQTFVKAKASKTPFDYTANRKRIKRKCSHCASHGNVSSDSESSDSSDEDGDGEEDNWMMELQLKQNHPDRLHPELWFNDKGEMNDGPLCRCSTKSRRSGIRHNIYAGEEQQAHCNPNTNNPDKLYHYRVTVSPPTNFLINKPTVIEHDNHEFIFEGFSLFSHHPLEKLPTCKVIRFNIQYTIVYIEEKVPNGFTVGETEVFFKYLFHEVLELVDLDLKSANDKDGCPQFHIMPRFVRELKDNGKELLPMYRVLEHFITSFGPVITEEKAKSKDELSTYEWQDFADDVKGMIIVKPGAKPCAMRVDQLDRESETKDIHPDAVHFGSRPLQLCFAGSPEFQKLWKEYVKLRHLVANKPKRTAEDKRRLAAKEQKLQEMRTNSKMKRGVTVAISSRGFYRTGIMCDMVQHAMLIPVLICHLRFHRSLNVLENRIEYKFKNRYLLQLALTHPSYRENFGTNPDHARNSLSNCGVRQPEYGDRRIHFQNTRKRGINTLINIMSKLGRKVATESNITHNERLEFLGDAVVEFITSIHLFHVFPDIEEGGLATYRAAIVQNQHLAHLAKKIGLEDFMLYAHGSDLCHEVELKHAMANCFEALMGALFLDAGIHVADRVFSCVLYKDNEVRFNQWMYYPQHPLQEQEPDGDRHWVKHSPLLKKLQYLEHSSGVIFYHIRLLARVFTTRSMGYTNLTMGSNQRLEFLGDTVLQLITSDYLYNHFPEHHEGHLSLLRSSLVNNRTQSVVCNDIVMPFFANLINPKIDLKMKDRADLLEAFLGAMYIDKGMEACEQFCSMCFFPRLQYFILNQEWNDPKSKLQQCCLTLRTLDGGEPDIPIYKVIEHVGPTNSRSYSVAVYFRNERLAKATGNSIQQAEMNAAKVALEKCPSICPQLDHQKRVIAKSLEIQKHEGLLTE